MKPLLTLLALLLATGSPGQTYLMVSNAPAAAVAIVITDYFRAGVLGTIPLINGFGYVDAASISWPVGGGNGDGLAFYAVDGAGRPLSALPYVWNVNLPLISSWLLVGDGTANANGFDGPFELGSAAPVTSDAVTNVVFISGGQVTVDNPNPIPVVFAGSTPLPVTMTDTNSPDVLPSFEMGFTLGLVVCGFGWIVRTAKKVGGGYD